MIAWVKLSATPGLWAIQSYHFKPQRDVLMECGTRGWASALRESSWQVNLIMYRSGMQFRGRWHLTPMRFAIGLIPAWTPAGGFAKIQGVCLLPRSVCPPLAQIIGAKQEGYATRDSID